MALKLQKWHWAVVGVVVLVGAPLAFVGISNFLGEREFQAALDAARKDGLATTAAELEAMIPTARPEENAAEFYRKLASAHQSERDFSEIFSALRSDPSEANLNAAEALLSKNAEAWALIKQATSPPKCWFDRDWSLGPALLHRENFAIRGAARLLAIQANVAAQRGDHDSAVESARQITQLARHLRQEPTLIAAGDREDCAINRGPSQVQARHCRVSGSHARRHRFGSRAVAGRH